MCHERERLIDYVYDECDASERALVNAHLETCATCREEIAGLRRTRQDLLAWEVPDHGSVWKPFAPARMAPSWRDVPAWAMAAAAGIMFLIGVSGGVTAQAFMRQTPVRTAAVVTPTMPATPATTETASTLDAAAIHAELTALEQKITQATRADINRLDQRVQFASANGAASAGLVRANDTGANLQLYSSMNNDIVELAKRFKKLEDRVKQAESLLATQSGLQGR